eukprot:238118-Chlamydomonas_euryale.AAC.1
MVACQGWAGEAWSVAMVVGRFVCRMAAGWLQDDCRTIVGGLLQGMRLEKCGRQGRWVASVPFFLGGGEVALWMQDGGALWMQDGEVSHWIEGRFHTGWWGGFTLDGGE